MSKQGNVAYFKIHKIHFITPRKKGIDNYSYKKNLTDIKKI